jgi:hypothetical protein
VISRRGKPGLAGLIDREARAKLGDYLEDARVARGWTMEAAAEQATHQLERLAEDETLTTTERAVARWIVEDGGITRHYISGIENQPAHPLTPIERRIRLLALVLALGADRARVNRLAGGI